MTYLLLAILISTLIVIAFRIFDGKGIDIHQAITVNYFVAVGFGLASSGSGIASGLTLEQPWLPIALVTGVLFIVVFYFFAFSAARAGVAITAVSSKMSVIIPVMAGVILFGESLIPLKVIGILMALVSFVMILNKKGSKVDLRYILLPLLLFAGNGINDSLLKAAEHLHISSDTEFVWFLTVVFLLALILGGIHLGIRLVLKRSRLSLKDISAGILLGFLNWGSTWFFLKGLSVYDVSLFVPVFNAGVVILSALAGLIFFREKLSILNKVGILLAVIAITMIAWT